MLALIITSWPWYARTYRALLLKERAAQYVESAIAVGAGRWRVLSKDILPNIIGPAAVLATANFGAVIRPTRAPAEAGLTCGLSRITMYRNNIVLLEVAREWST